MSFNNVPLCDVLRKRPEIWWPAIDTYKTGLMAKRSMFHMASVRDSNGKHTSFFSADKRYKERKKRSGAPI
jgi:hypothetical protein